MSIRKGEPSPAEADLMRAATALVKESEAARAGLAVALDRAKGFQGERDFLAAELDKAAQDCRVCRAPILTHALKAKVPEIRPGWSEKTTTVREVLELWFGDSFRHQLLLWSLGVCSNECNEAWRATEMPRPAPRQAFRVVKEGES